MLARPYNRNRDAQGCDQILQAAHPGVGITDSVRDRIVLTGAVGAPTGLLVYRECAYIHELECGSGPTARARADALANYAVACARAREIHSAVFLVRHNNPAMIEWAKKIGAVEQTEPKDLLFLLNWQ